MLAVAGARQRDVGQPQLLLGVVAAGGLPVLLQRVLVVPAELWQVGCVAAQRRGQDRGRGGPQGAGAVRGEPGLAHPDQEHGGPLQALGAVDGEQLDRVGLGGGGQVEAGTVLLGGQVGQQRRQRHLAVDAPEVGDGLDEQVEVLAPRRRRRSDGGGELDVDAGGVHDPAHQVEQRLPHVGAQGAELLGEQGEPLARRRGVRRRTGVVQRVVQRGHLGRVHPVGDRQQLLTDAGDDLRGAPAAAREPGGPLLEQVQVARPHGPAGPGEQRQQGGVRGDVLHQVQGGHDLGHLGQAQQPGQADDLDRDLGPGQRVEHLGGVRVVAHQHPDVGPGAALVVLGAHRAGQPPQLVGVGLVHVQAHLAGGGVRARDQGLDLGVEVHQGRRHPVGHVEHEPVGAAVDAQGEHLRRAGGGRERAVEPEDVRHRGPAPAVDGLVRVPDRGDRVPATARRRRGRRRAARASGPAPRRCPGTRRAGPP